MQVRVATAADIPEMQRIRAGVRENRLSDPTSVRTEHYQAMLAEHGRGFVALEDGRVVGFAVADRRDGNVWALFVAPASEGRGHGRRLHEAMLDWLFAAGVARAWLTTDPGTRAERFYRAAGWRPAGTAARGEVRLELERAAWLARPLSGRDTRRCSGTSGPRRTAE